LGTNREISGAGNHHQNRKGFGCFGADIIAAGQVKRIFLIFLLINNSRYYFGGIRSRNFLSYFNGWLWLLEWQISYG
jgi:hypothetical protein